MNGSPKSWLALVREVLLSFLSRSSGTRDGAARLEVVTLCRTPVRIVSEGAGSLCLINLHENEATSVAAARGVLRPDLASLVCLRARGRRCITFWCGTRPYAFDPNRIFTDVGLHSTLRGYASDDERAATTVTSLRESIVRAIGGDGSALVVALHNNRGGLSIHDYAAGGARRTDAAEVHVSDSQDGSTFLLVTERPWFERLLQRGLNVVLQSETAGDDGSLSVWCARRGRPYVNVEARHGDVDAQSRLLRTVLEINEQALASSGGLR